jgi:hypothetical protein
MKYLINAVVDFEVEADSRAAAHVAAVDKLSEAQLPGFDLAQLNIAGSIDTTGRVGPAVDRREVVPHALSLDARPGPYGEVTDVTPYVVYPPAGDPNSPAYAPMPID